MRGYQPQISYICLVFAEQGLLDTPIVTLFYVDFN